MQEQKMPTIRKSEVLAELCRRSFYFFVQEFWSVIIPEEPIWNWHIEFLCNEVQEAFERVISRKPKEYDYYIFNVPPGTSKTTIILQMATAWGWGKDPSLRYICTTYADRLSEQSAYKTQQILESEKYKSLFPNIKVKGGISDLKNNYNGQRYITSTGGTITGVHAHIKLADDPLNAQDAYSKIEREKAFRHVTETLGSRNVNHNTTITMIVMQRLHELDPTGKLLSTNGLRIKHICLPAELNEKVYPVELREKYVDGLLDPVRLNREILNIKKLELGSYSYAGQFLQSPAPLDGGIIKKEWFPIINKSSVPQGLTINFQGDTAYTEKTSNDPSGIMSYVVNSGNLYITNWSKVNKEFPDFCKWIVSHVNEQGYNAKSRIYIEPKANGKTIVQQLKATTSLNIIEDVAPTESKITRAGSCTAKLEAGRCYLVEGHWNEDFLTQVSTFPNAAHDEEVDCLTAAVTRELIKGANYGKYDIM